MDAHRPRWQPDHIVSPGATASPCAGCGREVAYWGSIYCRECNALRVELADEDLLIEGEDVEDLDALGGNDIVTAGPAYPRQGGWGEREE